MKKAFLILILLTKHLLSDAQNVGIGTNDPSRAKLEVHGAVGATSAIFGGESNGISLQRNWPGIGFNQYYNGGSKYIGNGYAAVQFVDQNNGSMAIDMFGFGSPNSTASESQRALVISSMGRINIGSGAMPNANLNVARGPLSRIHYATAAFEGSQYHSLFNYNWEENTYIRAGRDNGTVFINDIPGGKIALTGPVGINTATPAAALEIRQVGSNTGLALVNGNEFNTWSFRVPPGGGLYMYNDGNYVGHFWPDGQYDATSDSRLKTNVHTLSVLLNKVMQLRPVNYEMIYNNPAHQKRIGFLAQDVKKLFPELVSVSTDSASGYKDIRDVHTLNYSGFGVVAIKAIQEQQQLIQSLQSQVDELKKMISELHKK